MPKQGRFVDFLVICGIDQTSTLEPFKLTQDADDDDDDEKESISPLQRTYKPSVLSHYPQTDPAGKIDHDAINMLCFPHGVSFYEHSNEETSFHPFIITREDGSKLHAAALVFYEKVLEPAVIQTMNEMCRNFHRQLQKTTGRMSSYHPFTQLYASKCLCFILPLPFNRAAEAVLRQIYLSAINNSDLPITSYVYNILYEVPLPPLGRNVRFFAGKKNIICTRPAETDLPLVDYPMAEVIGLLGTRNLLNLFRCTLLEQRILLRSCHYNRLMMVAECITGLLFPFSWAHVYVPILPASLHHFLDAPVPFIMGLWKSEDDSPLDDEVPCEVCLVDIDNHTVEPPEDLPDFPYTSDLLKEIEDLCDRYQVRSGTKDIDSDGGSDSGMSSTDGSPHASADDKSDHYEALKTSTAFAQITAIASGLGVISSGEEFKQQYYNENKQLEAARNREIAEQKRAQEDVDSYKFTACLREVFIKSMVKLFASYEQFVIYPTQCDMSSWLSNREMMQNFDKEAFLGDQADVFLPFLCQFIETQMFATFIDNKIMSQWQGPHQSVRVFDLRNKIRDEDDHERALHEMCDTVEEAECLVDKNFAQIDYVALAPHVLDGVEQEERQPGIFPQLDESVLAKDLNEDDEPTRSPTVPSAAVPRRRFTSGGSDPELPSLLRPVSTLTFDPNADTVSEFIASLLKECKVKTKKMLVGKMGHEAVELGHGDPTLLGLEENTMIAGLCDLLERIWNHGLLHKQSKSPLWAHLNGFAELNNMSELNKMVDTFTPKPEGAFTDVSNFIPGQEAEKLTHRRKGSYPERAHTLQPLPNNLLCDIRHVQSMQEIKTDVGRARAFVRLALEKKVLAKHLKELLANSELTKSLYRRHAFLRFEDEREQAMFHLLSLNAADYHCFTNAFPNAVISYRVLVFPGKRFAAGLSTTTANVWISVAGRLRDSDRKWLPKNILDFTFESKNLGTLSTVRIGHDNSGMAPKWLVDYVLVRNETTGAITKFACGRWLGRGVDDDSTERILVGETLPLSYTADSVVDSCQNSPRRQNNSPKPTRRPGEIKQSKTLTQQQLSDSVNNLLKYFHKPEKDRGNVTVLLCGEHGLVTSLEAMLCTGFKSSRLFRNNLYIWDYLEKVQMFLLNHDTEPCRSLVALISIINNSLQDVGKDGKLQLLLCLAVRDHFLPEWLTYLHYCPISRQMYEESAFLLDEAQVQFLVNMLSMLRSYRITLEPSITKGLDI